MEAVELDGRLKVLLQTGRRPQRETPVTEAQCPSQSREPDAMTSHGMPLPNHGKPLPITPARR